MQNETQVPAAAGLHETNLPEQFKAASEVGQDYANLFFWLGLEMKCEIFKHRSK
jgi:hypothetical protein